MTDVNLSDTSTWLPLDGLAPGFDASKAPLSTDLDGRTLTLVDERGTRIAHTFGPGGVSWDYRPGAGDPIEAAQQTDPCEVIKVDDDLYYAQFHHNDDYRPDESVSLFLDLRSGYALAVIATLGERTVEQVAVQHAFTVARIEEVSGGVGEAPAPTLELIGRRVLWVYSSEHAYEHVYLSPHWYTWQCLAGPEQGLADTDENTVYRMRPGIYVFTWREGVIPCGSITIADHRDQKAIRSHGVLFGEAEDPSARPTHFTFGAHGRLISMTAHPAEYDPARELVR
ncbi:molybdenum cofactor biosynthesis F family protein [Microbacterium rhizosphaerae]|uniref:Molybdenum cofactor biosynthesis F family protein n=1 Tax=Microbacterium rhizosphaerae TaxID=1678237 RepID=A0ABZ0STZ7_9MICO|nr:molybdenum cofactor biosynthesis F family protein [Microbacterium rhizosphaerae]WPR90727.1 molybdenum cofactor biosynthesis F family protein [Microbacterium rhizosphaerae]